MRLTPLDIRNQPFPAAFRGLDRYAVKSFLEHVAGEYEVIIRQNNEFATQIKSLEQQLAKYTEIERVLNETLMTAQKMSDDARINAQKEAELIIKDAQVRATRYENEARDRVNKLENEVISIRNQRDSFFARFKALLATQLDLLEVISDDLRIEDQQKQPEQPRPEPIHYRQPQQYQQRAPIINSDDFGDDDTIDNVPPQPVILA